jgi:hypothetical protein
MSGQVMTDDNQLREADCLLREVAQEAALDRSPRLKAAIYTNLGYVLYRLGERDFGASSFRAALRAFGTAYRSACGNNLHSHPVSILVGMGVTLKELGDRTDSPRNLAAVLKLYRKALSKISKDVEPIAWARTRYNMASVLKSIGRCEARAEPPRVPKIKRPHPHSTGLGRRSSQLGLSSH